MNSLQVTKSYCSEFKIIIIMISEQSNIFWFGEIYWENVAIV